MNSPPAIQVVPLTLPHPGGSTPLPRGEDWVQWLRDHGLYEGFIQSLGGWMAANPTFFPRPAAPSKPLINPSTMAWDGFRLHDVPHELHDHSLMLIGALERPSPAQWKPSRPPPFQLFPARWVGWDERSEPMRGIVVPERLRDQPLTRAPLSSSAVEAHFNSATPPFTRPASWVTPRSEWKPAAGDGAGPTERPPSVLIVPPVAAPDRRDSNAPVEDDPLRPWKIRPVNPFTGRAPQKGLKLADRRRRRHSKDDSP